jgi:hypothetical protein
MADGKVEMTYRDEAGVELTERVYPCEANAWSIAHGQQPHPYWFGHGGREGYGSEPRVLGEVTTHYHQPEEV